MKKAILCASVCAALLSISAQAKTIIDGNYTATLFSPHNHHGTGTPICFTFKNKRGTIDNYRDSGTWKVESNPNNWAGNYVVTGDTLRFYGTASGDTLTVTDFVVDLKSMKGGWDSWYPTAAPIQGIDSGTLTFAPGC